MSFNTALSGLTAASNMLSITGNNIANANTTGFKLSRPEFADVYSSVGGVSKTTPGSGVVLVNNAQEFGQGNLQPTSNPLDLAISGDGFFVLGQSVSNSSQHSYTRNGAFHTDQNGYVVNNSDQPLMVQKPNGTTAAAGFNTLNLQPVQISTAQGNPKATSTVTTSVNLDASQTPPAAAFAGPVNGVIDPATYNNAGSETIYDSLGNVHQLSQYYVKTPTANQWAVYTYVDGNDINGTAPPTTPTPSLMQFDNTGKLTGITDPSGAAVGTKISYPALTISPSAAPLQITLDLGGSTQVNSPFTVATLSQDGVTAGKLTGVAIDATGVVSATYSNGVTTPLGRVAMARFENPQGLQKMGNSDWGATSESGVANLGSAGGTGFGEIKSQSLESSNVDISSQLVDLIVAQQAYQANAQAITTEKDDTTTLLQIR